MQRIPEHVKLSIEQFIRAIKQAIGAELVGFYLYGSLALSAYREPLSDIDFLAVTAGELSEEAVFLLECTYANQLVDNPLVKRLEGNFIPRWRLLADGEFACPQCDEGEFRVASPRDYNSVTLYSLRNWGVTMFGPPPEQLLPPVDKRAVMRTMLGNLLFLQERMPYYAENGVDLQVFGVLTLCRILYTANTGDIASKEQAARYAIARLAFPWRELVGQALVVWEKGKYDSGGNLAGCEELLEFAKYMKGLAEGKLKAQLLNG